MLRGIHVNRSVRIGERAIPVCAHAGRLGIAERPALPGSPVTWIEQLYSDVWKVGIRHHHGPLTVGDGVPRLEVGDPSFLAGVRVEAANGVGPVSYTHLRAHETDS